MTDDGRTYWERHAKNYDRSMALLGGPLPRMIQLTAAAVRGASKVLEVAAGTGLVTTALSRSAGEVVATDYAVAMVEKLEERVRKDGLENVRCEQADLYALRYEPATFDAVVAANVLHLVPTLPEALAALRRVTKPGGRIVVPTFCHDETVLSWMASRLLAITGFPGQRRFTSTRLKEALETAGIRVTRLEVLPGLIPIAYAEGVPANPTEKN